MNVVENMFNKTQTVNLDQYYTNDDVLRECAERSKLFIPDLTNAYFVDFSAGYNTFAPMLGCNYTAYDIDPVGDNIVLQDFLTFEKSEPTEYEISRDGDQSTFRKWRPSCETIPRAFVEIWPRLLCTHYNNELLAPIAVKVWPAAHIPTPEIILSSQKRKEFRYTDSFHHMEEENKWCFNQQWKRWITRLVHVYI